MSLIETFFRRCPNCGRRFEIRLIGKKLVGSESIKETLPITSDYFQGYGGSFLQLEDTKPAIVDIEEFQYAYRCKHCGHQWVEIKTEEHTGE